MSINIAIVEDEAEQAKTLQNYIERYAEERKLAVKTKWYANPVQFLEEYRGEYQVVYMDIMMPLMNGMDVARQLRERDEQVVLVFVTSMRQFAIQGYEVAASDYIVKPLNYSEFSLKFTRILSRLQPETTAGIRIRTESGFLRLLPGAIRYVEVSGHYCIYHTTGGEYRQYETIKNVEQALGNRGFARCNNYLLVNLGCVTGIDGMDVLLGSERLPMSNPRKKVFTDAVRQYMG